MIKNLTFKLLGALFIISTTNWPLVFIDNVNVDYKPFYPSQGVFVIAATIILSLSALSALGLLTLYRRIFREYNVCEFK